MFKVEDSIPVPLCSDVASRFNCPDCMSWYIGSTSCNLRIRIAEHRGVSYRTNAQITNPRLFKIREHALELNHGIREQDFNFLYRAHYFSDLRIAESLHIMKEKSEITSTDLATKLIIFS